MCVPLVEHRASLAQGKRPRVPRMDQSPVRGHFVRPRIGLYLPDATNSPSTGTSSTAPAIRAVRPFHNPTATPPSCSDSATHTLRPGGSAGRPRGSRRPGDEAAWRRGGLVPSCPGVPVPCRPAARRPRDAAAWRRGEPVSRRGPQRRRRRSVPASRPPASRGADALTTSRPAAPCPGVPLGCRGGARRSGGPAPRCLDATPRGLRPRVACHSGVTSRQPVPRPTSGAAPAT